LISKEKILIHISQYGVCFVNRKGCSRYQQGWCQLLKSFCVNPEGRQGTQAEKVFSKKLAKNHIRDLLG